VAGPYFGWRSSAYRLVSLVQTKNKKTPVPSCAKSRAPLSLPSLKAISVRPRTSCRTAGTRCGRCEPTRLPAIPSATGAASTCNLQHAILATGTREPYLKRLQFDLIYSLLRSPKAIPCTRPQFDRTVHLAIEYQKRMIIGRFDVLEALFLCRP
jgi:hypothetical protein